MSAFSGVGQVLFAEEHEALLLLDRYLEMVKLKPDILICYEQFFKKFGPTSALRIYFPSVRTYNTSEAI